MNNKRLSYLCDMLVTHIIYHRTRKALLIAQYLRRHHGMYLDMTLDGASGYRFRK